MDFDFCYHTHTFRCGHASGEDREYVEEAIKAGIKYLGFSDHMMVPGFNQPGVRGNYELIDDYINSVRSLQKEYKDKINIYLGFEVEYSKSLESYYEFLKREKGFDYLICGQHMFFDEPTKGEWIFRTKPVRKFLRKYVKTIKNAIKSRIFLYIAHPDIFLNETVEIKPYLVRAMRKICKCAVKYDVPLEINMHGLINNKEGNKKPYCYPTPVFYKIAAKCGCRILIGVDAHNPIEFRKNYYDEAINIANECGIKIIHHLDIKNENIR